MVDEAKRLTVERAKAVLGDHGRVLGRGTWLGHYSDESCAVGLLVLDHFGVLGEACVFLANATFEELEARVAKLVGLTEAYVVGLNNGFEDRMCYKHFGRTDDPDYQLGLEDGRRLAELGGFTPYEGNDSDDA